MDIKDLKKYAKAAKVSLVTDRPNSEPDLWRVVFGKELNGFSCDTYAKDKDEARDNAVSGGR